MKKSFSLFTSLVVSGSLLSASIPSFGQNLSVSDPLFKRNTCDVNDNNAPSCIAAFLGTLFESVSDFGILVGDYQLYSLTSRSLKSTPTLRQLNIDRRLDVLKAKNTVVAEKREAMIKRIQAELDALKKAANEGKDVHVTTLVDETNTPVFDAAITKRIAVLRQDLAELRASDRRELPANIRATIEKTIERDTESLARLEAADPIEHVIHGKTSVTTATRVIYAKDLQPAITKVEQELATWEKTPIVTAEAKAEMVYAAELVNSSKYVEMLATSVKRGLLRGAQTVEFVSAGVLILDGTGRVLLFFTGFDPNISPAIKILGGNKLHQEIFGK